MHILKKFSAQAKENRWNRWRILFDMLEDRHVVPIAEIIAATGAKAAVIEKDIDTLVQRGLVGKTAKGGLTLENFHAEKSLEERSREDQSAKVEIARMVVAKYIENGMTLFIDGSTTVLAMAPFLAEHNLRIVTNGLSFVSDLRSGNFIGEIICVGGLYRSKSNTVVGEIARSSIDRYSADLAILGVEGISSSLELMEAHPAEALLKQSMLAHAKRAIVLAMPHKFNDDSLLAFAKLQEIEALVSTRFPDPEFNAAAKNLGVRLECPARSIV